MTPAPDANATAGATSARVGVAQLNLTVGDLAGNEAQIATAMDWAESAGCDVLVLPELAVTAYPVEDLLASSSFVAANQAVIDRLAARSGRCATIVGFVDTVEAPASTDATARRLSNSLAVLCGGKVAAKRSKVLLPNYGVFDEMRYFSAGSVAQRAVALGQGPVIGLAICEDLWRDDVADAQVAGGAQILIVANASPYHQGKAAERAALVRAHALRLGVPVVYANLVGGQDELVFDGGSTIIDADGNALCELVQFAPQCAALDVALTPGAVADGATGPQVIAVPPATQPRPVLGPTKAPVALSREAELYQALVLGLGDYLRKSGFDRAVIGLSGGIDSALAATITVDALGPGALWGVGLPGPFSSPGSVSDAAELAGRLGVRFDVVPITGPYDAMGAALRGEDSTPGPLWGTGFDVTEENLQARLRGVTLMALTNKFGGIVITTSNKSESAVGYTTLYGDMAGGFAPLKDVAKLDVFALSRWRNSLSADELAGFALAGPVNPIPEATLTKAPSAELAPNQRDDLSLPPYEVLDPILEAYVERCESVDAIAARGYEATVVARVAALVDRAEYKRRQAAPGVKITRRAFGRDRRLPIVNAWRHMTAPIEAAGAAFLDEATPRSPHV